MWSLFPKKRESGEINGVWIALVVVLGGGLYLVLTFIPPWYKSLQAKSRMNEVLSGISATGADNYSVAERIAQNLNSMGLSIGASDIDVQIDQSTRYATAKLDWKAPVPLMFTRKVLYITFRLRVKAKMI